MSGAVDRAGARLERNVADYFAARGFPFDKAPLRGSRDLLDISGTLPMGWLIGCKAIHRGVPVGQRMSDAMHQCHRAMGNLALLTPGGVEVFPFQVLQRSGFPVGQAYVVTELDWMAEIMELRAKLEAGQ